MLIALIDKHPVLLLGLTFFLKQHFTEITVKQDHDINEYHALNTTEVPDLIIQGINEDPTESNVRTFERIRSYYPQVPVIIYDENPLNFEKESFLKAGINGYTLKQNHFKELLEAIDHVLKGKQYITSQLM